jgi:predicted nucleic acid-binding protein
MKYVIDTSVEVKTFVQEQDSAKAVRLRNDYHQGVHELIAPDIFPTEMCNVLMILERSGKIKPGDAELFVTLFLSQLPPLFAAIPLLPRALEVARQFRQNRLRLSLHRPRGAGRVRARHRGRQARERRPCNITVRSSVVQTTMNDH